MWLELMHGIGLSNLSDDQIREARNASVRHVVDARLSDVGTFGLTVVGLAALGLPIFSLSFSQNRTGPSVEERIAHHAADLARSELEVSTTAKISSLLRSIEGDLGDRIESALEAQEQQLSATAIEVEFLSERLTDFRQSTRRLLLELEDRLSETSPRHPAPGAARTLFCAGLSLRKHRYAYLPGQTLSQSIPRDVAAISPRFATRVGGIAFQGVAQTADGSKLERIYHRDLSHSDDNIELFAEVVLPNGSTKEVSIAIPSWQWIPIVRYSASRTNACFTLFGDLVREDDTATLLRLRGGRILNYHAAFEDTLLGLRLYQADIMAFDPNASDIPKLNGTRVLGFGEEAPSVASNRRAQKQVDEVIDEKYQSYIISDLEVTTTYSISGDGALVLSGNPMWWLWKETEDGEIEFDQELSKKVSADIATVGGINPIVYDALRNTMNLSALLRSLQASDMAKFEQLADSLPPLERPVYTPTVQVPD